MRRLIIWIFLWSSGVCGAWLCADDKTPVEGDPLVKSDIETEQGFDLATVDPDGAVKFAKVRLHWSPAEESSSVDDSVSFDLDVSGDSPGAAIFTSQLWNASLASAMAWQEPWLNAHWKVIGTPPTDGTGIEAGLAVGMITTSARRKFPDGTVIVASLNPDGSLGAVPKLMDRLRALSDAHTKVVVISALQQFDVAPDGTVINFMQEAEKLGMQCYTASSLVEATEKTMKDPLPKIKIPEDAPPYNHEIASYIADAAHDEESDVAGLIRFAPSDGDLSHYPPYLASRWKEIRASYAAGKTAMDAGQLYQAYRDFCVAGAGLAGTNAAALNTPNDFDVKGSISQADDLRKSLDDLLVHPPEDQSDLRSALVVSEMADWVRQVESPLEGAEMLVKQTYSQRSDATLDEQSAARVRLVFCLEQARKRMHEADFFAGLTSRMGGANISIETRSDQYYGQLLPSELATAQLFFQQIRDTISESGSTMLFDHRIAHYIQVVRQAKALWETRMRQKEIEAAQKLEDETALEGPVAGPVTAVTTVSFDPGNTYTPPRSTVFSLAPESLSKGAQCLCWANDKCEISMLSEKYLGLANSTDPKTLEWHTQDGSKLKQMITIAEENARLGIALAAKTGIDTSILSMIYEQGQTERQGTDDLSQLEALRSYWRCCLLGNLSWQLSYTPKAKPVDLGSVTAAKPSKSTTSKKATPTPAPLATLDLNSIPVAPAVTDTPTPAATPVPTPSPEVTEAPQTQPIVQQTIPVTANPSGTSTDTIPVTSTPTVISTDTIPVAPIATNEPPAVPALPVNPSDLVPPPSRGATPTPAENPTPDPANPQPAAPAGQ